MCASKLVGLRKNEGRVQQDKFLRKVGASAPNRKWIADFTYVWTAEGWLYGGVPLIRLRLNGQAR